MKPHFVFLFCFVFAVLCLTDCDKDDPVYFFQIGDKSYEITHGDVEYYGEFGDAYSFGLNLLSPGIAIDSDGYWRNSGTGIWFVLISPASEGLISGAYGFKPSYSGFSIIDISYCLQWSENHMSNKWVYIDSGTVDIINEGNDYTITIEGTDEYGSDVKGYFRGTLKTFDFSGSKGGSPRQDI